MLSGSRRIIAALFLALTLAFALASCGAAANTAPQIHLQKLKMGDRLASVLSPTYGELFVGTDGTWSRTPSSFTYQWQDCDSGGANCLDIVGETTNRHFITTDDSGHTLQIVVTATFSGGQTASQHSSPTGLVPVFIPEDQSVPTISGVTTVGQTLTANPGTWTNSPTAFSYDWQNCAAGCTSIGAPDQPTYLLAVNDTGDTIRVVVTASNGLGDSTPATSAQTGAIQGVGPITVGKTTIGGTANGGSTADVKRVNKVTASATGLVTKLDLYLSPTGTVGTQAYRGVVYADSAGAPGALLATSNELLFTNTSATRWYDLTFPDSPSFTNGTSYWIGFINGPNIIGQYFYDSVTNARDFNTNTYSAGPSNPFGTVSLGPEQMSVYATIANASSPDNTVTPTVTGTATEGQTLIAHANTWTGSPTFTYQWQDCTASGIQCVNVASATNSVYLLQANDVGNTVRVVVTGTNTSGVTSASSAVTTTIASSGGSAYSCNNPGIVWCGKDLTCCSSGATFSPTWQYQNYCGKSVADSNGPDFTLVSDPSGSGHQAIKVQIDDACRPYSENYAARGDMDGPHIFAPGTDYWVGDSLKLEDFTSFPPIGNSGTNFLQLNEVYGCPYAGTPVTPALYIYSPTGGLPNHWAIHVNTITTVLGTIDNAWHDVIYHVHFSTTSTGFVQVWFDGSPVALSTHDVGDNFTLHYATLTGNNYSPSTCTASSGHSQPNAYFNVNYYRAAGAVPGESTIYHGFAKVGQGADATAGLTSVAPDVPPKGP